MGSIDNDLICCLVSLVFALLPIATTRGRGVLDELIWEDLTGFVNFEDYSSNCSLIWQFDIKVPYYWAHLIRDVRFFRKRSNEQTKTLASKPKDRSRKVFSSWYRRDKLSDTGGIDRW